MTDFDLVPQLLVRFPQFRAQWETRSKYYSREAAARYNKNPSEFAILEFARYVVEETYLSGDLDSLQQVCALMEICLADDDKEAQTLVTEVFECLRYFANMVLPSSTAIEQLLGPKSRRVWDHVVQVEQDNWY